MGFAGKRAREQNSENRKKARAGGGRDGKNVWESFALFLCV